MFPIPSYSSQLHTRSFKHHFMESFSFSMNWDYIIHRGRNISIHGWFKRSKEWLLGILTSFVFFFPGFRFIFTFLGVGIVVCLSTVGGHIIANRISNSTLLFVSFLLIINITRKNKRDSEAFQALSFSRTA